MSTDLEGQPLVVISIRQGPNLLVREMAKLARKMTLETLFDVVIAAKSLSAPLSSDDIVEVKAHRHRP